MTNIIKPLWTVLEKRMRNRFALSTSLEQLADVLNIPKLYESVLRRLGAVLKANGGKTP